jgi:uncharacterized membrane protein (GlpM family)
MESMTKVFISYSRSDMEFVQRLAMDLQGAGVDVWWDLSDIQGSDVWERKIEEGLRSSQYFIVVLTPASLESRWVRREYLSADNRGVKIIPLRLKPYDEVPLTLRDIQPIEAINRTYEDVLTEVFRALKFNRQNEMSSERKIPDATTVSTTLRPFRLLDLISAKGEGTVDVVGTIPLIIYFALAALYVLTSSDSTNQLMMGVFSVLAGIFLIGRKQIPPGLIFKISLIVFMGIHTLNYRASSSSGEILEGIVALICCGLAITTVRAPKKPLFYSSISLSVFLMLIGAAEILNSFDKYPSSFPSELIPIMGLISILLIVMDL